MFNAKQYAALNHFAHNQNKRNCSIAENFTIVEGIENHNGKLFAFVKTVDCNKGIFHSQACIAIGPRGGVKVYGESRDIY